ncbi:MAG: fluoride efflux transporter CrcB [Planctomycetaceae bacterium]
MTHLFIPIAVGFGGFVGAVLRFYLSGAIIKATGNEFSFVGTLVVNLVGCFAIGILWTLTLKTNTLSPVMQRCLITGLLGSLTTFSTFSLDSLQLLQSGRVSAAVLNVTANVLIGLLLVWLGMAAAGMFVTTEPTG